MYTFYRNIPNYITLCNGICGMLAIIFAQQGQFVFAIITICCGTLFDAFDGKVARMLGISSEMGGELDSLCDCVTFGIAPASLMLFQVQQTFGSLPFWSIISASVYLSCVIWRLARFNVETTIDPEDHKSFNGLPSPLGAGMVCSGLWIIQIKALTDSHLAINFLLILSFVTGILMVSRIRFVHLVSYLSEHLKTYQLIALLLPVLALCIFFNPISWAFCFPVFLIVSLSLALWQSATQKEKQEEKLTLA